MSGFFLYENDFDLALLFHFQIFFFFFPAGVCCCAPHLCQSDWTSLTIDPLFIQTILCSPTTEIRAVLTDISDSVNLCISDIHDAFCESDFLFVMELSYDFDSRMGFTRFFCGSNKTWRTELLYELQ